MEHALRVGKASNEAKTPLRSSARSPSSVETQLEPSTQSIVDFQLISRDHIGSNSHSKSKRKRKAEVKPEIYSTVQTTTLPSTRTSAEVSNQNQEHTRAPYPERHVKTNTNVQSNASSSSRSSLHLPSIYAPPPKPSTDFTQGSRSSKAHLPSYPRNRSNATTNPEPISCTVSGATKVQSPTSGIHPDTKPSVSNPHTTSTGQQPEPTFQSTSEPNSKRHRRSQSTYATQSTSSPNISQDSASTQGTRSYASKQQSVMTPVNKPYPPDSSVTNKGPGKTSQVYGGQTQMKTLDNGLSESSSLISQSTRSIRSSIVPTMGRSMLAAGNKPNPANSFFSTSRGQSPPRLSRFPTSERKLSIIPASTLPPPHTAPMSDRPSDAPLAADTRAKGKLPKRKLLGEIPPAEFYRSIDHRLPAAGFRLPPPPAKRSMTPCGKHTRFPDEPLPSVTATMPESPTLTMLQTTTPRPIDDQANTQIIYGTSKIAMTSTFSPLLGKAHVQSPASSSTPRQPAISVASSQNALDMPGDSPQSFLSRSSRLIPGFHVTQFKDLRDKDRPLAPTTHPNFVSQNRKAASTSSHSYQAARSKSESRPPREKSKSQKRNKKQKLISKTKSSNISSQLSITQTEEFAQESADYGAPLRPTGNIFDDNEDVSVEENFGVQEALDFLTGRQINTDILDMEIPDSYSPQATISMCPLHGSRLSGSTHTPGPGLSSSSALPSSSVTSSVRSQPRLRPGRTSQLSEFYYQDDENDGDYEEKTQGPGQDSVWNNEKHLRLTSIVLPSIEKDAPALAFPTLDMADEDNEDGNAFADESDYVIHQKSIHKRSSARRTQFRTGSSSPRVTSNTSSASYMPLDSNSDDPNQPYVLQVLGARTARNKVQKYLVQWSNLDEEWIQPTAHVIPQQLITEFNSTLRVCFIASGHHFEGLTFIDEPKGHFMRSLDHLYQHCWKLKCHSAATGKFVKSFTNKTGPLRRSSTVGQGAFIPPDEQLVWIKTVELPDLLDKCPKVKHEENDNNKDLSYATPQARGGKDPLSSNTCHSEILDKSSEARDAIGDRGSLFRSSNMETGEHVEWNDTDTEINVDDLQSSLIAPSSDSAGSIIALDAPLLPPATPTRRLYSSTPAAPELPSPTPSLLQPVINDHYLFGKSMKIVAKMQRTAFAKKGPSFVHKELDFKRAEEKQIKSTIKKKAVQKRTGSSVLIGEVAHQRLLEWFQEARQI